MSGEKIGGDLTGKTVLVTSGAVRVGKILALAAAKAGADVILHYSQSEQQALQTKREIEETGVRCWTVQQDFSHAEELGDFLERCWALSPIDVLVNNAAIFKDLSLGDTTPAEWRAHMAVNLDAPFYLTQRFVQLCQPARNGRVINLLDWRAMRPGADHLPYTISKAGLAALTKSVALSAAPRVLVNGIALGAVLPPLGGVDEEALFAGYPIKRWVEPQELAQAFLFLAAGPEIITGDILFLDGGRHLY
jgi:NAD(P)-dependent dehydrogenase (short-subunit alcohol dehydrogenase family)